MYRFEINPRRRRREYEERLTLNDVNVLAALTGDVVRLEKQFNCKLKISRDLGTLLVVALGGPTRAVAWAATKPLEQIMLEKNVHGCELRRILELRFTNSATEMILRGGICKLMEIPALANYATNYAVQRGVAILTKLHSIKKINYKNCLANDAIALRTATPGSKRFMVKKCGLSPSDFASAGLPWPEK